MKRMIVGVFAAAFLAPVAALGAPAETVAIELKGIQRGAVIEGPVAFEVEATSPAGIKRLDVFIGDIPVAEVTPDDVRQNVSARHEWMTTLVEATSDIAPNGEYAVRAKALANGGASKEIVARVVVDNPAAAPTGVTASSSGAGVRLEWQPNPEPDILGYEVQRGDGTTFAPVGQLSGTVFEEAVAPGTYSYRVVAVRNSAARTTGRASLPSEPVQVAVSASSGGGGSGAGSQGGPSVSGPSGFKLKDSSFAPRGLPAAAALPGQVGAAGLPDIPEPAIEWGTFDRELPYELPEGGVPLSAGADGPSNAPWRRIPPDALRWVGAGALLLLIAGGLLVIAKRIDATDPNAELKL